jgi:hypothetical protein
MSSERTSIARTQFHLDFNSVHPGQNFVGIDRKKLRLAFHLVRLGLSYKEHIEAAEYKILSGEGAAHRIDHRESIIEASFILLTSRTSPAAPQPFIYLPRQQAIPQEII